MWLSCLSSGHKNSRTDRHVKIRYRDTLKLHFGTLFVSICQSKLSDIIVLHSCSSASLHCSDSSLLSHSKGRIAYDGVLAAQIPTPYHKLTVHNHSRQAEDTDSRIWNMIILVPDSCCFSARNVRVMRRLAVMNRRSWHVSNVSCPIQPWPVLQVTAVDWSTVGRVYPCSCNFHQFLHQLWPPVAGLFNSSTVRDLLTLVSVTSVQASWWRGLPRAEQNVFLFLF